MKVYDTIIIGAGQAGLSVAYFFRRTTLSYLLLDNQPEAGGAWLNTWDSLTLFSPAPYSSLSGWRMPQGPHAYPGKTEFTQYLQAYEERYQFPIQRPVQVMNVTKDAGHFTITTDQGTYHSKTLVSATGTAANPYVPAYKNVAVFGGQQLHSSQYRNPTALVGKRVLIVGGGNSGAQILAEVSRVAHTQWVTLEEPRFLPDDIDGRYLFEQATNRFLGKKSVAPQSHSLGDIVMLQTVKEARSRGVLHARRPFPSFYKSGIIWPNGEKEAFDTVIWCTGFKANLKHLEGLNILQSNKIPTQYTRSIDEPNLWLVGYGNWTGYASATIYGVGKTARDTAREINEVLNPVN